MTPPRIKVAMLSHSYHPIYGGAERVLAATIPHLQALGVEVHVLTRRFSGLPPFEEVNNVPVYRLPIPGPKPTASLSFTMSGLSQLAKLKPDIIHAHGFFATTTTAVTAKTLFDIPLVVKAQASGHNGDVHRLKQKLLGHQRMQFFRRQVDIFVTISRDIDRELDLEGVPVEHRVHVPNGVDTKHYQPPDNATKAELRRKLNLPASSVVALFTGRLAPEKQLHNLVAAWKPIREVFPQAVLVLVGKGPEETALKQAAGTENGVLFPGSVEDVLPYLQAADIFVLPSAREGLSNALLEAMSTGLAAVATTVGGNPELVADQESGLLVPPNDSPALTQALLALLKNDDLRARMGQTGRQHICAHYDLEASARGLHAIYSKLVTA
jgi:glycosyltransferase involved in cell wall biosynthesis